MRMMEMRCKFRASLSKIRKKVYRTKKILNVKDAEFYV